MRTEQARAILDDLLTKTNHSCEWSERYEEFLKLEPCIAATYKTFISGRLDVKQFYEHATQAILISRSPLGRML